LPLGALAAQTDDVLVIEPVLFPQHSPRRPRPGSAPLLPGVPLPHGLRSSDARKATDTAAGDPLRADAPERPHRQGPGGRPGGEGTGGWPPAPPGSLLLVCEWPAVGIRVTSAAVDAQLVIDAAARAQALLPHPGEPQAFQSGCTSYAAGPGRADEPTDTD